MRDSVHMDQEWKKIYGDQFEEGDDGLPIPGQVIKNFREMCHLTTEELAMILGVKSKRTVERMENENLFLDSITRRRALATALRIPPFLLGITMFRGMPMLEESKSASVSASGIAKTLVLVQSVQELKDTLSAYWRQYETGTIQEKRLQIEQEIEKQRHVVSLFSGNEERERRSILCGYYLLAVDIARNARKYSVAFRHADSAVELALSLNTPAIRSPELVAAAFMGRACARFEQGRREDLNAVKKDYHTGLLYAERSRAPLQGAFLGHAGVALIYAAQDAKEREEAMSYINRSGQLVGTSRLVDTLYEPRPISEGWYQSIRAQALIRNGEAREALKALDETYETIPEGSRLLAFNHLYRASAEALQGNHMYATELAGFALDLFEDIHSAHGVIRVGQLVENLSQNAKLRNSVGLAQLRVRLVDKKRRQRIEAEGDETHFQN